MDQNQTEFFCNSLWVAWFPKISFGHWKNSNQSSWLVPSNLTSMSLIVYQFFPPQTLSVFSFTLLIFYTQKHVSKIWLFVTHHIISHCISSRIHSCLSSLLYVTNYVKFNMLQFLISCNSTLPSHTKHSNKCETRLTVFKPHICNKCLRMDVWLNLFCKSLKSSVSKKNMKL